MSILRTYINGVWKDICDVDYRLRFGDLWPKIKNNDKVFVNGEWKGIICSYDFLWIIDDTVSYCEKSDVIVDVPFTYASPLYNDGFASANISSPPGFTPLFKKNIQKGTYIIDLNFIFLASQGPGPNVFVNAFADGNPSFIPFTYAPIGQISDSALYPTSRIELSGVGSYNLGMRGHIDVQGRIWVDQAAEKAITAWNPNDTRFIQRVYDRSKEADFGSTNSNVNTGFAINPKYKKVTNDVSRQPLDVNNQLVSATGLPQDTMDVPLDDPNYRVQNLSKCPVDAVTIGNQTVTQDFTRNNCDEDYEGSVVPYTVAANTYYAPTQSQANMFAQNEINSNGQTYANVLGTCTQVVFYNTVKSQAFTRNNCGVSSTGNLVVYTVPERTFSASSQEAADQLAIDSITANGQTYANNTGTCTLNSPVQITFNTIFGSNPSVWNGIIFRKNATETDRVQYDSSGVQNLPTIYRVGDTITIVDFTYPSIFPWIVPSKSNMNIKKNNATVLFNQDQTVQQIELSSFSVTLTSDMTSLDIVVTGSSTATGYLTRTLQSVNNNSSVDNSSVKITDNTTGLVIINVNPELGSGDYSYNILDDSGTMTVEQKNNTGAGMNYSITGEFGYSYSTVIAAGATATRNDVPKGTITITTSA